jgi:hypothetical protein
MVQSQVTRRVTKINTFYYGREAKNLTLPHKEAIASSSSLNSSWLKNKAEALSGVRVGVLSGNFDNRNRMFSMQVDSACAKLWTD